MSSSCTPSQVKLHVQLECQLQGTAIAQHNGWTREPAANNEKTCPTPAGVGPPLQGTPVGLRRYLG
jgi:hypothetical protein